MTADELKKKFGKSKLDELCKRKRRNALPKNGIAQRLIPKETRK